MKKSEVQALIKRGEYAQAACLLLAACEPSSTITGPDQAVKHFM